MKEFEDVESYKKEIEGNIEVVAKEFESEGMGEISGKFGKTLKSLGAEDENNLSEYALLYMVCAIASADGQIVEKEKNYISKLFPLINIEKVFDYFSQNTIEPSQLSAVLSEAQKTIIFLLAWQIALSDGELHEDENRYLNQIKDIFELSESQIRNYKLLLFAKLAR